MVKKVQKNNPRKEIRETDGDNFFSNNSSLIGKILGFSLLLLTGILMMFGIVGSGGIVGLFLYKNIALSLFGYIGLLIPFILIYSSLTILFPERLMPRVLDIVTGSFFDFIFNGALGNDYPVVAIGRSHWRGYWFNNEYFIF
jgi:hypothetical protein